MSLVTGRYRKLATVAGGAAVAASMAPALGGTPGSPDLVLEPVSVTGDAVEVMIWNTGLRPLSGVLHVEAALSTGIGTASTRFFVGGGQKIFVHAAMGSPVGSVLELGAVLDDGAPF